MKINIIALGIFIILIVSCQNQESNVKIIENFEWEYLTDKQITEAAMPINENFEQELQETMLNLVKNWHKRNGSKGGIYPLMLTIYIDEAGDIDFVKDSREFMIPNIIPIEQRHPQHMEMFYPDKNVVLEIIPIVESWKFSPANVVGMDIKYQKTFGAYYKIDSTTDGKFKLLNKRMDFFHDYSKEYFVMVEEMPAPIGGIKAIQSKIKYPEIAKRAGIQGRVYVKAYIDENGDVSRTEVLKGIGSGCDQAAIKAVEQTKFTPGRQKGKPVKVQVSVPILFKLD